MEAHLHVSPPHPSVEMLGSTAERWRIVRKAFWKSCDIRGSVVLRYTSMHACYYIMTYTHNQLRLFYIDYLCLQEMLVDFHDAILGCYSSATCVTKWNMFSLISMQKQESIKLSLNQLPFNNPIEDDCVYSQKDTKNTEALLMQCRHISLHLSLKIHVIILM